MKKRGPRAIPIIKRRTSLTLRENIPLDLITTRELMYDITRININVYDKDVKIFADSMSKGSSTKESIESNWTLRLCSSAD